MRSPRVALETTLVLLVPALLTAMFRPPLDLGLDHIEPLRPYGAWLGE